MASFSPSIPSLNDDVSYTLEPINGTNDFRINLFKGQDRPLFHDRHATATKCVRPAKCEKLLNTSCFGTKIPFRYTSTYLTAHNQGNIMDTIRNFEALRNVPKCWAVVQVKHKQKFCSFLLEYSFYNICVSAIFMCRSYAKM